MKKMIAFLLVQSRVGASRKRVDWTTVIAWVKDHHCAMDPDVMDFAGR
jgi:hypothetical protein